MHFPGQGKGFGIIATETIPERERTGLIESSLTNSEFFFFEKKRISGLEGKTFKEYFFASFNLNKLSCFLEEISPDKIE